jgi:hypothetical protein
MTEDDEDTARLVADAETLAASHRARLDALPAKVDAAISAWLSSVRNTPLSESTAVWNFLNKQLPLLGAAIKKEI